MATMMATRIKVEPQTCATGAELTGVNLGDASRDDAVMDDTPYQPKVERAGTMGDTPF